jgi:DNA-binding response OmpR family regulator
MSDIVVVDDDQTILDLLSEILTSGGHRVRALSDGETALAAIDAHPPDLIILDMSMPAMDGFTLARKLRQNRTLSGVPILAVTMMDDVDSYEAAYDAGCNGFIAKPIGPGPLLARVAALLGGKPG